MSTNNKWEVVDEASNAITERLKVDGGHLYHRMTFECAAAMCFVPDVDLQRYQAHLRDAYTKGYAEGHADAKINVNALINDGKETYV